MSMIRKFIFNTFKVEEKVEELKKAGIDRFVMYGINYYNRPDDTSASIAVDTLFLRKGDCYLDAYTQKGFFKLGEVVEISDLSLSDLKSFRTKYVWRFIRFYQSIQYTSFSNNGFHRPLKKFYLFKTDLNSLANRCTTHPEVQSDSTNWRYATSTRGESIQSFTRSTNYMKHITIDTKPIV